MLIEPLRAAARQVGYAITVHGSLQRDIDLVAVPWTDEAVSAGELAQIIFQTIERINGIAIVVEADKPMPRQKPHGRLAWSFHLGGGPYIDLSVMPRGK